MKVVDPTTLYNFYKGSRVLFSTDFAGTSCQHRMPPVLENRRYCQSIKFFANFHSKFEMPIYTKVVSLNKMDNFH
jgi:flavorubredoxin